MQTEYIKYSVRNNVKNEHLAHLMDFIERDIGWDDLQLTEDHHGVHRIKGTNSTFEYEIQIGPKNITLHERGGVILMMDRVIFFSCFSSILPYYK